MPSDPAEELSLLSISEDLVPCTVETPSQEVILAFGGLLSPPLVLQTNETECKCTSRSKVFTLGFKIAPDNLGILPQRSRANFEMCRRRKAVAGGDGSGRIFTPQQDG